MTIAQQRILILLIATGATIAIAIYLLPWLIAAHRKAEHTTAIGLLNLLLGWTAVGYIAALVWAVTDETKATAQEMRKLTSRASRTGPYTTPHAARAKHEQPTQHTLPHSVRKRNPWH